MRNSVSNVFFAILLFSVLLFTPILSGCSGGGGGDGSSDTSGSSSSDDTGSSSNDNTGGSTSTSTESYIVVAWNDVGMHTMNPTYDTFVIAPPNNNLWAQVIKVGDPPVVTTSGITVEYSVDNNTSSADKSTFGQFWDNVLELFGLDLANDVGLFDNGLSGEMQANGDHFVAEGIPVTPIDDDGSDSPFQVAVITVKDSSGQALVSTQTTLPVSDDINCARCHEDGGDTDILALHDADEATAKDLSGSEPVLCVSCHQIDNNLAEFTSDIEDPADKDLATAMHDYHNGRTDPYGVAIDCKDCHPNSDLRSTAHADEGYSCEDCHGTLTAMVDSPSCATTDCHEGVYGTDTSGTGYRYTKETNHGSLYCAGCHQVAHAVTPSDLDSDNYQALQYQGWAMALGDCRPCHRSSIYRDISGFNRDHVGTRARESYCNICHTDWSDGVTAEDYPHQYSWQNRY
jgi:hypothetical protein